MTLVIARGQAASAGETWTPTKQNNSTVPTISVDTQTIVGRNTAGTGSIEELTPAQARAILGLATTDSPTFAGATFTGTVSHTGNSPSLYLGNQASSGAGAVIRMAPSNSQTNWLIGANQITSGVFEVIPSTAGGGTTFSTPMLSLTTGGLTIAGTVTSTGNMNAPAFNVTSARRFKKNIRRLTGLAALLKLRPVIYDDRIGRGKRRGVVGFIAEEVGQVLPAMVARDAKRRPYAVNYGQLVALSVAAAQDHETRLRRLEGAVK